MNNKVVLRSRFWYAPRIALLASLIIVLWITLVFNWYTKNVQGHFLSVFIALLAIGVGTPNPTLIIENDNLSIKRRIFGTVTIPIAEIDGVSIRPTYRASPLPDVVRGLLIKFQGKVYSVLTNELRPEDRKSLGEYLSHNPKISQEPVIQALIQGNTIVRDIVSGSDISNL